jgi:integrase
MFGLATAKVRFGGGENDKLKFERITPLSPAAVVALTRAQGARGYRGFLRIPFPNGSQVTEASAGVRVAASRARLVGAGEAAANLPRESGGGWHSLRRKFATGLKHVPLKDLSYLGGWKDHQTILACYQRADTETMQAALKSRTALRA